MARADPGLDRGVSYLDCTIRWMLVSLNVFLVRMPTRPPLDLKRGRGFSESWGTEHPHWQQLSHLKRRSLIRSFLREVGRGMASWSGGILGSRLRERRLFWESVSLRVSEESPGRLPGVPGVPVVISNVFSHFSLFIHLFITRGKRTGQ